MSRISRQRQKSNGFRLQGESLESRVLLTINPTGIEQAYLESINRFRADPQAELSVLFSNPNTLTARDPAVQAALNFFNVDASLLLQQWSELEPAAPVAWNEDLIDAALAHNNQMILHDEQAHVLPGEAGIGARIRAEGYQLNRATENIYAFAENHIHGHAGFIIDWGEGPGGIQDPAGHRDNYLDRGVQEVGISVVAENDSRTDVGPFLVTQDFGRRSGYRPQVLGVVYNDTDNNGIYDPGEGLGNVDITVRSATTGETFSTVTLSAGGYQLEVPDGTYDVIASGGGLGGPFVVGNVVMSGSNVKADFEARSAIPAPMANNDTIDINEDTARTFLVTPNDVAQAGAIVNNSVVIVQPPGRGTATVDASGRITYTPDANFTGNDTLGYTVRDSNGATSNTATVTLRVADASDPPVLSSNFPGTASTVEDSQVVIDLGQYISDVDGDLDWNTLVVTSRPANGTATVNAATQQIIYTPDAGYSGSDSLSFQVGDSAGQTIPETSVAITVTAVNDPPIANGDVFTIVDRSSGTLSVLTNDEDPDGSLANATISIVSQPQFGLVSVNGQNIQFTFPDDYIGQVTFQYLVNNTTLVPAIDEFGNSVFEDGFGGRVSDEPGNPQLTNGLARAMDEIVESSAPASVSLYVVSSEVSPWQNPANPLDVTGDGVVAPLDAITVINALNASETTLSAPTAGVTRGAVSFVDVAGNGVVAPLDAIQVINELNSPTPQAAAALSAAVSDELYANDDDDDDESSIAALPFWSQ